MKIKKNKEIIKKQKKSIKNIKIEESSKSRKSLKNMEIDEKNKNR